MKINPSAAGFWVISGAVGWLIGGNTRSAVIGFVAAWVVSLVVFLIGEVRNA